MSALDPTYFLKWVPASDSVFDPSRHANISDEVIYGFRFTHQEAQIPTISVDIENPGISLVAPGRDAWAWISMVEQTTGHKEPIIFARLVEIPTNLVGKVCTVVLSSRADDYMEQKFALAQSLKVPPNYNAIFVDPAQADDPDKVLEGYSRDWHIDRLTCEWTTSDYVIGEDGLLDFTPSDWFWDSLDIQVNGTPLVTVRVKADVEWQQEATGFLSFDPFEVPDGVVKNWPKKGASIGGGWTVDNSIVIDSGSTDIKMITETASYKNSAKAHLPGDIMSWQWSSSHPRKPVSGTYPLKVVQGITTINPSDPDFTDHPTATSKTTYLYVNQGSSGKVGFRLKYDLSQGRSENLQFDVIASLQPVFTSLPSINGLPDPTQPQDFETISFSGRDITQPAGASSAVVILTWTSIKNLTSVGLGTTIKASNGSYQRAVQAGHAGTTQPTFSAVPGTLTTDGGIVWASLGNASQSTYLWRADNTQVLAGQFWHTREQVGNVLFTATFLAQTSGLTGTNFSPNFTYTGTQYTPFTDGTVTWVYVGSIGNGSINYQTGGTTNADSPAKTDARYFFPSAAGLSAIQYFAEVARAHILQRCRCVQIKFQVPTERFWDLSCRKNAEIHGNRIPGGSAVGKITQYDLTLDGNAGTLICEITMLCAIGYGNGVIPTPGEPTYGSTDYMLNDYQEFTGGQVLSPAGDVAVSGVRFDSTQDNQLELPLTKQQVIVHGGLVPDTETTTAAQKLLTAPQVGPLPPSGLSDSEEISAKADKILAQLQLDAKKWRMEIKPVTDGPFKQTYYPVVSELVVPMQIDLGA